MRLYSGTSKQFIEDTVQNQIAGKLQKSFFRHFRYKPPESEVRSWRNSLRAITMVVQSAELLDHGVILEYQLPLSSRRLDFLICGKNNSGEDNAVIVELKQWERCEKAEGEKVITWIGGGDREVLHPSVQVGQYHQYLKDVHTAFYDGNEPITLGSCSYLHNYNLYPDDPLLDSKFINTINRYPLYSADDVGELKTFLATRTKLGNGLEVLQRIEDGKYRPSKKLMDHVGNVIKNKPEYTLLDEQLVVFDKVLTLAKRSLHDKRKAMIIVRGGPGTGKSVIAINLMAELLLDNYNSHYATGSKAFTETLRKVIGSRGAVQFKYLDSYMEAEDSSVDILIADEAHRLRKTSAGRFTPKKKRTGIPQVDELIKASKVSVLFIDDKQVIRPYEVGSIELMKEAALRNECELFEYELDIQFRCGGSEDFINWINNTLQIEPTANVIWDKSEDFDFRILQSPDDLESEIRDRVNEGHSGRLCAGFCWPWSKKINEDGTLKSDVEIGDYSRPWNARPEATRLAIGIPKSNFWAHDPKGINQVGCIYTAQGFEFDYVGVIFGRDLAYDWEKNKWMGHKDQSHDTVVKRSENFTDLVKNAYRVLLTRGIKGCYVYFVDKETEKFFKSRTEDWKKDYMSPPEEDLRQIGDEDSA